MHEILICKIPIIFHNGFLDLVFFYQNFIANLPLSHQIFFKKLKEFFYGKTHN